MARHTGPVCKLCRREGVRLYLKGTRCSTGKCPFARSVGRDGSERLPLPPGVSNFRRAKQTDYAIHLREKQKVKRYYGVQEGQFRTYYSRAESAKGNTGEVLMSLLERRLDNIVYRLGFALSRPQARQLVSHNHITVNGRTVNIGSYLLRVGDVIRVQEKPRPIERVTLTIEEANRELPEFLIRVEGQTPAGQVVRLPEVSDVGLPVETQLIVEFCSR